MTGKENTQNTSQSNVGECVRQASRKNAKESKDAMVIRPTNPGGGSSIETKQEKQMNQGNSSKVYADQQKTKALKDFSYSEIINYYEGRYYDPVIGTRKHPPT